MPKLTEYILATYAFKGRYKISIIESKKIWYFLCTNLEYLGDFEIPESEKCIIGEMCATVI